MRRPRHHVSRREFMYSTGALAIGAGGFPRCTHGDERTVTMAEWRPCVDVGSGNAPDTSDMPLMQAPVREREDDLPAPVDLALVEQNPNIAAAISDSPEATRASAAQTLASTTETRQAGLPGTPALRMAVQSKWDISLLKVYFYHGADELKTRVLQIAKEWSQHAKIDFDEVKRREEAQIRVAFQRTGHWSYVGLDNRNTNGQTMNLELAVPPKKGDYNYGVVLHEFGHALGCIHEHQSPSAGDFFNESEVIRYYRERYGWDANKTKLNVLTRYNTTQLLRGFVTALDRLSIMMYSNPQQLTKDNQGTPVNVALSGTDMKMIQRLYPGRGPTTIGEDKQPEVAKTPATIKIDDPPVPAAITVASPTNKFDFEVSETGTYTMLSHGSTQLVWKLLRNTSDAVELKDRTYDLVNRFAHVDLTAGKYRIEVQHKHEGGVGEYGVQVLKGKR